MIIGSIAPDFRPDRRLRGHEVSFQNDLLRAARGMSHDYFILIPESVGRVDEPNVVACLSEPKNPCRCVADIGRWLESVPQGVDVTVILYEGSLAWLPAFDSLAADWPEVKFIVNLFFPEAGLDVPSTSNDAIVQAVPVRIRFAHNQVQTSSWGRPDPQENVIVLAETHERSFLAEAFGVRVDQVWPLHSQLSGFPSPTGEPSDPDALNVLIPLAPRQVRPRVMRDIDFVTRQVARAKTELPITWTITGPLGTKRSATRLSRRLRRSGILLESNELEISEYASLFAAYDVVWLPIRGHYTTQSSGKALDALVSATPVIAPAGSYAAKEQRRWVSGAPAYEGRREAVELFLALPALVPTWKHKLQEANSAIRFAYSAESALEALVRLAKVPRVHGLVPVAAKAIPLEHWKVASLGRVRKHLMRLTEGWDLSRAFLRFLRP